MPERFKPAVLRVLREAGWSDGRRAATAASSEAFLQAWGFAVHRFVAEVISEFDGLKCMANDTQSWLNFDVRESLMWNLPWQTPAFAWIIGQPLCPVAHGNGSILLLAESGEVVWLKDDWLGYVREESFPFALDTHFRADYGRTKWVYLDEEQVEQEFARLKPAGA
jgi:hypothetical protein